nr:unnamed protein product [Callosobruchus analis]
MANMTNEETFKFLELYQAENCLWNPKNEYHKNKNVVKEKKNNLMATFRLNLKNKLAYMKSVAGEDEVYQPIWIFDDVMAAFLKGVYESTSLLNTDTKVGTI